jgi:anti-sigma factor ChrR (cupin superfamily)
MIRRQIIHAATAAYVPDERYGEPVAGMNWCNVSYDRDTGLGSFLLRMDPGTRSRPHEHVDFEEFFVIDGALIDDDGAVFRTGDFVSFCPGSKHWSTTEEGCTLAVFLRRPNRRLAEGEFPAT